MKSKRINYRQARDWLEPLLDGLAEWANGAILVVSKAGAAAYPIKKSSYGTGTYYYSRSWKPLMEFQEKPRGLHMVAIFRDGRIVRLRDVTRNTEAKYHTLVEAE